MDRQTEPLLEGGFEIDASGDPDVQLHVEQYNDFYLKNSRNRDNDLGCMRWMIINQDEELRMGMDDDWKLILTWDRDTGYDEKGWIWCLNYVEWLNVLINEFFGPWNWILTGKMVWIGAALDAGIITIRDNALTVLTENNGEPIFVDYSKRGLVKSACFR